MWAPPVLSWKDRVCSREGWYYSGIGQVLYDTQISSKDKRTFFEPETREDIPIQSDELTTGCVDSLSPTVEIFQAQEQFLSIWVYMKDCTHDSTFQNTMYLGWKNMFYVLSFKEKIETIREKNPQILFCYQSRFLYYYIVFNYEWKKKFSLHILTTSISSKILLYQLSFAFSSFTTFPLTHSLIVLR